MMRRIFAFLLAFLMAFSSVPSQVLATMIQEETVAEELTVTDPGETTAAAETTEPAADAPSPLSETAVPETTVTETVPATTAEDTVPATTAVETVPETPAEVTVPETTAAETVPETTAEVTVPETTAAETVPETTEEEILDEDISEDPLAAVTLTGNWAADTLAIAQSYVGYTQETDADGNAYTVFGDYFGDAANTEWNTHFIAYCLMEAGVDNSIFPINVGNAESWKNSLEAAGYYHAKDSGYTPVAGDLIFWSGWYPVEYQVGILTDPSTNLTADFGNQSGKVGTQKTWDAQIMGYARIPNSDGTLQQSVTAKVYTDDTFATEDTSVTAVVDGALPLKSEIRVYPVTLTAGQSAALSAIGDVKGAYGVKLYVNGAEYTGAMNSAVNVQITSDAFGTGEAMMPYDLASMDKLAGSLSGSTLGLNVKLPVSFGLVGISSTTVTTAAELKAAVEMGVPEITLGADITVDAANDNIAVNKAVKIELNGKSLTAAGDEALFRISGSGNLTMEDNGTEAVTKDGGTPVARPDSVDDAALGSVAKDNSGKAVLTYYTTKSTVVNPNGATTETRYKHTVSAAGMIENKTTQPLFAVNGGTLNINGGVYVGNLDGGYTGRGIEQNGGTTNLNGGYLAGFNVNGRTDWSNENDFGGAVRATGGNLNIGEAVIAANQAASGAGVYAGNTTVVLNNGVISGNKTTGKSDATISDNGGPHFGGAGVYLGENGKITVNGSGSYITNNSAPDANGYADGGAAIFAKKWTNITINNGYITSNTVGGGGGAIRTIYGTETNYAHSSSDAVKQQVEMSIYINGGFICGNFCRYAEGGGVSVNAGTGCWITGGYINNNATMTQRDWGGGGLFNANGSYLEIKNVLITENTAVGLGGGVGGCSTGDIHLAVTEGGAMFDNTAMGQNWSGEGSTKRDDQDLAKDNPNFDMENADDYFCVHNSKVEAQMLGRGSCNWVGTCDDAKVTPPQRTVLEAHEVMGLTSYAMDPGKMEARMAAKAYINGNYSNVHGGGIMCNGVLDVGTPMAGPMPAWLEVVGEKQLLGATLAEGMFTFELELVDGATGKVIATGTNRVGNSAGTGKVEFGQQLAFTDVGTYKYIIREKDKFVNGAVDTSDKITYDDVKYEMVVETAEDADLNIIIESVTITNSKTGAVTNVPVAQDAFYVTLPENLIHFENTSGKYIIVQAHKVWEDDSNRDGIRPASIVVELYANGVSTGKTLTLSNTNSTTNSNSWSGQFGQLERYDASGKEIAYTVKEVSVPEGYAVTYGPNEHDGSRVITNTHKPEETSVTATKIWQDNSDQDGKRPDSVVLTLYADGDVYLDEDGKEITVTLGGTGNTWTASVSGLPKYKTDNRGTHEIVYTFEETTVPTGYTKVVNGTTVTNSYTPEEVDVKFEKTWTDNNDQDGKRPDAITVNLLANGQEVDEMTVTATSNYGGTFENLPKYENGVLITYTVTEDPVDGYDTVITGNAANGFKITNTHEIEKTELSVKKVWNDFGNQDNKRTAGVIVALYGNDKKTAIKTATLNSSNKWETTWTDLDLYAGGHYIDYSVVEIGYVDANGTRHDGTPEGYSVEHSYNNVQGSIIWTEATVTNTLTPELTTLNVQKEWDDAHNQDGIRPTSIELTLWKTTTEPTEKVLVNGHYHYVVDPSAGSGWTVAKNAEGKDYVLTMTPNASGAWDADFEDLPKNEAGKRIYYAVTEKAVAGYDVSYELAPDTNVLYVKNSHKTEETEISVFKTWDDAHNQDGVRPASIKVSLYGRDKTNALYSITLPDADGNWNYTWKNLPKNYNGTEIIYTVVEEAVPGYNLDAQNVAQEVTGAADQSGNIVLKNVHVPETTDIPVQKIWTDKDNQDGVRPQSITVELLADGKATGKKLTLKADTNWYGTFTDLPVYKTKTSTADATQKITYEILEAAVEYYNLDAAGKAQSVRVQVEDGKITKVENVHETEETSIPFTKVWNDSNNQDAVRPASVTIWLYADGTRIQSKTLTVNDADVSNSNIWKGEFTDLPVYKNGKKIVYTVDEIPADVPAGYTVSVNGNTITNTHITEKTEITITKTWADNNNQDGIRPAKITVRLYADGQEVDSATYDASTDPSYTFTGLEKYKNVNGKAVAIVYTVTEDPVPGYVTTISGLSITNTHKPEETQFSAEKTWVDDNNHDGMRPASVKVQLYADGIANGAAVELNAGNSWKHTWQNLPKYKNVNGKGVEIKYSVDEVEVPEGYTKSVNGGTVTNTHVTEKTEFEVTKVWNDENNQDGLRPVELYVQLYADGAASGPSVKLEEKNGWKYKWTDLDKFKNVNNQPVEIKYTVDEVAVPAGYTKSVDGATITNTHVPEETDIKVLKVWQGDNPDGTAPLGAIVTLYGNGTAVDTVTLDASNSLTYTWTDLPVNEQGTPIDYQVLETGYVDKDGNTVTGKLPTGYSVDHSTSVDGTTQTTIHTVTNIYSPATTFMNVQKTWTDAGNQDNLRVYAVEVTLFADGVKTNQKAVLYSGNSWDYTFLNLQKNKVDGDADADAIVYTVQETGYYKTEADYTSSNLTTGVPSGYTVSYDEDYTLNTIEVTNTHEIYTTEVPVQKIWEDANDQDGLRPDSVTVTLYANGEPAPASVIADNTAELNESNGWAYTFTDLPVNYGVGTKIVYTVVEENVDGYALTTSGDATNGYVLTNTHVPEEVEVPVTKNWADANDQDGLRPTSITVILEADGTEVDRQTIGETENWKYTFKNLPKYKAGKEIVYTVDEIAVNGYQTEIDGYKITNRHKPEETSITANKVWVDNGNQDGKRPASIKLHLLADGRHTNKTAVVTPDASGNWTYTWDNLPKYDDGVEIDYAVMEETIGNGYYSTVDGYTVTNTYAPEKTSINVWKKWEDGNNQDNVRPDSITVTLLADGQPTGKTLILTAANHWHGNFAGLDKFKNGVEIKYSVKETAVSGYAPGVVTGDVDGGFTITNTRETEKTSIKVSKVWDDANNQDGARPKSVMVTLYRDGVSTGKFVELSDSNNWTFTWNDLDVHHSQGTKYAYSVVETVPAGYTAVTTGSAATGFVITNKRDADKTSIPVIKVWDDNLNQDGKRPASITVELLADGVSTGKTLTLTAAVNWRGAFTELDKNANGKPIEYSVHEAAIAEYNVDKNGVAQAQTVKVAADGTITLTNKHEIQDTKLEVRKVWDDFNNNDGQRPYAVVITLHEEGAMTNKTLTLSEDNGWTGSWDNMPRYKAGKWIAYSVVETGYYKTKADLDSNNLTVGVPSGYKVTHSYDRDDVDNPKATVTNTYAPESTGLNVQKHWDDDNDREGIRPKELKVTLYRKVGDNGTWSVVKDSNGQDITVVLNESNQWDATFTNLPKYANGEKIYYNAVEEEVPGYESGEYKLNDATGVVVITNTNTINRDVKIAVSKVWEDNDDQDKVRPAEIEVTLYANGIKTSSTKKLNEANGWKAEWTGLYEYYKGSKIVYTVVEENVPAGYKVVVTGDAATGFVITNTHDVEKVEIPVSKVWDDNNNQDGMRPGSISVELLADGKETGKTLTLNAKNLWQGTFTDLDKNADGKQIIYSVREAKVAGYNLDAEGLAQTLTVPVVDGKVTITNVRAPELTSLTAVKKWHDNEDQDGKRPDSITVHLLANGVHMGESYTRVLTAKDNWTCTWENLQKYESGQLIRYTVYEEPVSFKASEANAQADIAAAAIEHYVADYVRDSETQITINNRYVPETTVVEAVKVWEDDDNRDGLRPDALEVTLLANGKDTKQVKTMNKDNKWSVSWTDLPKYENQGKLIEYTVKEVDVEGYVGTVAEKDGVFTLTNTHAPVTTGVKVTKTWLDDNNNDGARPDGLIVQLYADGKAVEGGRATLSDLNGWTYTFQSTDTMPLYVYNDGKLISYNVQEVGYVSDGVEYAGMPAGYAGQTALGENSYTIAITNTRASEKIALKVNKVWNDGNNSDATRPASVQVTLMKNGAAVETVTLNQENGWTYSWNDLYKYAGGVEVTYTVVETVPGAYAASYAYSTTADGKTILATVTNSYTPVTKWFAIQKIWNDKNNAEGLRPSSVTVQIYKNGAVYGDPIVLSAANNWMSPMNLPVYENGVQIQWTIKEIKIPRYYYVSYDQNTLTVTNTIQSKEVPKTGDDSNLMLWVGMLAVCGAGAAAVLFADKKKKRSK